jgi:hypothetical protein
MVEEITTRDLRDLAREVDENGLDSQHLPGYLLHHNRPRKLFRLSIQMVDLRLNSRQLGAAFRRMADALEDEGNPPGRPGPPKLEALPRTGITSH